MLDAMLEGAERYREQGEKELAESTKELVRSLRQLGEPVVGGDVLEGYSCEFVRNDKPQRIEIRHVSPAM
jgi:hypothetical protein